MPTAISISFLSARKVWCKTLSEVFPKTGKSMHEVFQYAMLHLFSGQTSIANAA
jgi:hypothetical protein